MKRCECGRVIWPWQNWVPGYEATTLHAACVEPEQWGWTEDIEFDFDPLPVRILSEADARAAVAIDPQGRILWRGLPDAWVEVSR